MAKEVQIKLDKDGFWYRDDKPDERFETLGPLLRGAAAEGLRLSLFDDPKNRKP